MGKEVARLWRQGHQQSQDSPDLCAGTREEGLWGKVGPGFRPRLVGPKKSAEKWGRFYCHSVIASWGLRRGRVAGIDLQVVSGASGSNSVSEWGVGRSPLGPISDQTSDVRGVPAGRHFAHATVKSIIRRGRSTLSAMTSSFCPSANLRLVFRPTKAVPAGLSW